MAVGLLSLLISKMLLSIDREVLSMADTKKKRGFLDWVFFQDPVMESTIAASQTLPADGSKDLCKKCGYKISDNDKFCTSCGDTITPTVSEYAKFCGGCGFRNVDLRKFCGECGTNLEVTS